MNITYFTRNHAKVYYFIAEVFCLFIFACTSKRQQQKTARNYYNLAMVELSENPDVSTRWKRALQHVNEALRCEQTDSYCALKATLLFLMGKKEESDVWFKRALKICNNLSVKGEIKNNYACLLADGGFEKQALQIWQDLEDDPAYMTPEVALVNKGKVLAKKKQFKAACKCFSQAVFFTPSYVDAQFYLAMMSLKLHDYRKAKDCVKTLLYLDKQHNGARLLAKQLYDENIAI